jgi:hypothetical protein
MKWTNAGLLLLGLLVVLLLSAAVAGLGEVLNAWYAAPAGFLVFVILSMLLVHVWERSVARSRQSQWIDWWQRYSPYAVAKRSWEEENPMPQYTTPYGNVERILSTTVLSGSATQTRAWGNKARWPCSGLEGNEVLVEFDSRGNLVDLFCANDGVEAAELFAWSTDVLDAAGLTDHPARR